MDHNNILAVVLAGGKSERFGQDIINYLIMMDDE